MSTFHHCMLVQIKIIDSGFAGLGEFQLFPVYQKEETRKNQSLFIPGRGLGGGAGGEEGGGLLCCHVLGQPEL